MAKRNEIKMPTNPDVQYMQSWCTNFLRKGFGKNVVLVPANKPKPPPPVPQLFRINPMYQQPLSTRRRSSQNGLKELIPVPIPEEKPRLSTGRRSHSRSSQIVHARPSTERRSSSLNPMLLNTSGTPSPTGQRLSTERRSHSRSSQIVHARPSTERRSRRMLRTNSNPMRTPS